MMFLTDPIHKDKVAAALRANHASGMAYGVSLHGWRCAGMEGSISESCAGETG